jgi:hypothetical protein
VVPDGVFLRPDPDGRAEFHQLRAPESDDLQEIVFNVHQRFRRWLGRHGLLKRETDGDFSNEAPELSALDACAQGSLGLGNLVTVRYKPKNAPEPDAGEDRFERRGSQARVAERDGYSLYAGEAIPGGDRDACERLLRYCLRPPLSLERLSLGPDGSVIYQVKATRRGKATQRVMDPLQFMARIVALIPPPYHPLLRYFGIFAPHSSWRACVVPETRAATEDVLEHEHQHDHQQEQNHQVANSPVTAASEAASPRAASSFGGSTRAPSPGAIATLTGNQTSDPNSPAAPSCSTPPRQRPRWYIDWHTLLARVHDFDSLACPCGGRLEFVQLVTEPEVARDMLRSMGLPDQPPPVPRARSPAFDPDPLPADWD